MFAATSIGCAQSPPAAGPSAPPGRKFPLPLTANLPYDVDLDVLQRLDRQGKVLEAQREFDILSWQTFIALNWPADASGQPAKGKSINDTQGDRVWSFWRPASTIFLPAGAMPAPWNTREPAANAAPLFRDKAAWRQHDGSADQNFQAFSGPLVDQNGKWVRYQVLVNHEEFDYLIKNKLYSLDGQVAFTQKADNNDIAFPQDDPARKKHGAIEIKFAWKELGANDDPSRFFTQHIRVLTSEPFAPGQTEPATQEINAGLVGMHIAMRTRSSPEWVWATFEQIDNVRANPMPDGRMSHPNFFNAASNAPPNRLPKQNAVIDPNTGSPEPEPAGPPKATTWIESLTTTPVQVQRIQVPPQGTLNPLDEKIAQSTAALNPQVQAALRKAGSVFQYYELIGTQWPVRPNAPAFAGGQGSAPESITHKTPGDMVPVFLVNTTMETYFQKGLQNAGPLEQDDRIDPDLVDTTQVTGTESCVGCHYSAGAAVGFKRAPNGSLMTDANGKKIPIFGENGHFGKTGNAAESWLLQIEGQATPVITGTSGGGATPPVAHTRPPAGFLDIHRLDAQYGK